MFAEWWSLDDEELTRSIEDYITAYRTESLCHRDVYRSAILPFHYREITLVHTFL